MRLRVDVRPSYSHSIKIRTRGRRGVLTLAYPSLLVSSSFLGPSCLFLLFARSDCRGEGGGKKWPPQQCYDRPASHAVPHGHAR